VKDRMDSEWKKEAEKLIEQMLGFIGENPQRDGLKDTPRRVVKSWEELYKGYKFKSKDIKELLTEFEGDGYDELVLLRSISFNSMCEHHCMPFSGIGHIGYIPNKKVVGISKLARLLNEVYAPRLQIQERITVQVTNALMEHLQPQAAGCILIASHSCMSCRGVKQSEAEMITSSLEGTFKTDHIARSEFLNLVGV